MSIWLGVAAVVFFALLLWREHRAYTRSQRALKEQSYKTMDRFLR